MLRVLLLFALLATALLLLFQHRLIYFPRKYQPADLADLPGRASRVSYTTAEGAQVCFYIPPVAQPVRREQRIWLMFPGNASLALDWTAFVSMASATTDGYLLIDYPGYGECEGTASPRAIDESTEMAFQTLLKNLGKAPEDFKVGAMGISLGSAGALQFSVRHPVDRIVLIAPFSTMLEEAKRMVGIPLCYLLRHRFDNRSRLAELSLRPNPPRVSIFHGTDDVTVPCARSRQLKALFPKMIAFTEVPGADHDSILSVALPRIQEAMED